MKRTTLLVVVSVVAIAVAAAVLLRPGESTSLAYAPPAPAPIPVAASTADSPQDAPGFYAGEAGLSPAARAGREIWYKATAGNSRFHTYVFQQRIGIMVDWFRVLRADRHDDRFAA